MIEKNIANSIANILEELDSLFKERDSAFPIRDEASDKLIKYKESVFVEKIERAARREVQNEPLTDLKCANNLLDNGVFLCGYMKSGTTLLLQLLDAHPDLVVLPGDSWFMGRIRPDLDMRSREFRYSQYRNWLTRLINPTGQAPFWLFGKDPGVYLNFLRYCWHWDKEFKNDEVGYLKAIVIAHLCANPKGFLRANSWVEKTPGNERTVQKILNHFPDAKFIHIVRDPRENLASLKRLYATRNWKWDYLGSAHKLSDSCRLAVRNQNRLGKRRYHVLTYEDLTKNVDNNMRRIADFLEISCHNCLLAPTVNGLPAQANSMYSDRKVKGKVRTAVMDKWKRNLNEQEKRAALSTIFSARKVGYNWNVTLSDLLLNAAEKVKIGIDCKLRDMKR